MSGGDQRVGPGAYGAWAGGATLLGLASDLVQPLGAVAAVILFVFIVATVVSGMLSLIAPIRGPMRTTALFCLIGSAVFTGIVALQYTGSARSVSAERGFVAAAVPAVAAVQEQVLQVESGEIPSAEQEPESRSISVAAPLPPAQLPTSEPGVFRNGTLAVRVESAAVSSSENGRWEDVRGTVTLSVHNTGASAIAVTLMREPQISLALDNGVTLYPHDWSGVGLQTCYRSTCSASDYSQIPAGSSITVNVELRDPQLERSRATSLPRVRTASLAGRLNVVEGEARARFVQLGLANFPITNNTSNSITMEPN